MMHQTGLGAVLSTARGTIVEYALTKDVIETDHKPLEWLQSKQSSHACSQKLERWALQLRGFDFSIVYHQGSQNQHADALSWRPVAIVAVGRDLDHTTMAAAQKSDPVLHTVITQRKTITCWKLEEISLKEIPSTLASAYYTSVCPMPQGKDPNTA